MVRSKLWMAMVVVGALGCATQPPVVNVAPPTVNVEPPAVTVQAQPCNCDCSSAFAAKVPQIGKGCWVQDDVLVCPLVYRNLDVEPAYPGADPRCERQADGTLRCEVKD